VSSGPAAIELSVSAVTDTGLKRTANEDSYLAESPVFVVADGMGGYEAGDRASAAVVGAFRAHVHGPEFPVLSDIRDALTAADAAVAEVAAGTRRGAGSTATGVVLVEHLGLPHWLVFNVGDSRVYRHVGSELEQLTIDHSLGQELVDRGELRPEQLRTFSERNVITRAIGAADSTADSWLMPVTTGERLLLCSDGLHSELGDEAIRATLTMSGRPASAATALVDQAKRAGGRDNITVIVLDVLAGGGSPTADAATDMIPLAGHDPSADDTTVPVHA
jgi:PPM family protein phosphatase